MGEPGPLWPGFSCSQGGGARFGCGWGVAGVNTGNLGFALPAGLPVMWAVVMTGPLQLPDCYTGFCEIVRAAVGLTERCDLVRGRPAQRWARFNQPGAYQA